VALAEEGRQGDANLGARSGHEAIRDLVRAREAAMEDLREKRQQLQSFLLRHGRLASGRAPASKTSDRGPAADGLSRSGALGTLDR